MFKEKIVVFFYTEWPVHAGSGSSIGVVDLPIQREVFTGLPIFQPSGLKGALREYFETNFPSTENEIKIKQVFGPPKGADYAGAISLSQARVILFPLASAKGVFAYATCPLCLQLLRRDLAAIEYPKPSELTDIPLTTEETPPRLLEKGIALVPKADPAKNLPGSDQVINGKIILGEFAFEASPHSKVSIIAKWLSEHAIPQSDEYKPWQEKVKRSLIILDDNTLRNLTETRTEIVTRNVIDDKTGTSKNVWTEEYLPTDTLLYSILSAHDPLDGGNEVIRLKNAKEVIDYIKAPNSIPTSRFFFGGDQTVGRGLLKVQFLD
jgi:CRISPR-associated protein Cmr4